MPELPEVEVIRQGLAPRLVGRRFLAVHKGEKKLRRESSLLRLQRLVVGRRLTALKRRGKYLLFQLEGGATLVIHLGMTGRLLLWRATLVPLADGQVEDSGHKGCEPSPPFSLRAVEMAAAADDVELHKFLFPHVHLRFQVEGDFWLLYQDVRRFGQVLACAPGEVPEALGRMGREPFSRRVKPEWLLEMGRRRKCPLKNFLLDGRTITGIGNIYASEIMFAAQLSPTLPVSRLTLRDWQRIIMATRRILRLAIRRGGTTVNDYLNCEGKAGLFQFELMVYGRAGEPCKKCGALIERLVQAGRSTFYCPWCQKNQAIND